MCEESKVVTEKITPNRTPNFLRGFEPRNIFIACIAKKTLRLKGVNFWKEKFKKWKNKTSFLRYWEKYQSILFKKL